MSERNAVGVAPLVAGLAYLGTSLDSAGAALHGGLTSPSALAALAGVVGSLAAIAVGAGVLLGWRSFEPAEMDADSTATATLLVVALAAFALGAAVSLL